MTETTRYSLDDLLAIMARLRDPDSGCPWDVKQDFASVAPYTLEEAYEVVDAIDSDDRFGAWSRIGDLDLAHDTDKPLVAVALDDACFWLAFE